VADIDYDAARALCDAATDEAMRSALADSVQAWLDAIETGALDNQEVAQDLALGAVTLRLVRQFREDVPALLDEVERLREEAVSVSRCPECDAGQPCTVVRESAAIARPESDDGAEDAPSPMRDEPAPSSDDPHGACSRALVGMAVERDKARAASAAASERREEDLRRLLDCREVVRSLTDERDEARSEVERLSALVNAKQSWIDGAKVDLEAADVPMSPNKGHDETGALADLQERIARAIDHRWDVEADSNEPSGYTEGLLDGLDAAATVARETPLRGEP
jgi:hypothetical protein